MVKKLLIATAATGLMFSTALAQTTTPPTTAPAPSTAPAEKMDTSKAPATKSDAKFVSSQGSDHWVASKFKGVDVMGPNDEKIGDVDDLLFDKEGKILAVVVGVGGFLGIGQKDVALDMAAFQVVPASTGATNPNDVKLKLSMTKDDLKNAPAFAYYKAPTPTAGTAGGTNTGTSRPASPAPSR
ncbi:MAG: PRC-barrel domain-containing protein [Rhizobiales bacterium]|jgi:hypothetical protein|nr:PRC-barrel domain-containing protein [Hyphomicrobiales bacterium]